LSDLNGVTDRLSEARNRAGLTQKDVAKALEVTIAAVQAWEYGRAQLTISRAAQLASLYGVSIDYLAWGADKPLREDPRITKIRKILS
jgi:transcriptional regulator with XRE-family HTH domain